MQQILEQADTIVMEDKAAEPFITTAESVTKAKIGTNRQEVQYITTSFTKNTNKKTAQDFKTQVSSDTSPNQETCLRCFGRVCADKNFLIPVIIQVINLQLVIVLKSVFN